MTAFPVDEGISRAEPTFVHLNGDNYHESQFFPDDLDVAANRNRRYKMTVLG